MLSLWPLWTSDDTLDFRMISWHELTTFFAAGFVVLLRFKYDIDISQRLIKHPVLDLSFWRCVLAERQVWLKLLVWFYIPRPVTSTCWFLTPERGDSTGLFVHRVINENSLKKKKKEEKKNFFLVCVLLKFSLKYLSEGGWSGLSPACLHRFIQQVHLL